MDRTIQRAKKCLSVGCWLEMPRLTWKWKCQCPFKVECRVSGLQFWMSLSTDTNFGLNVNVWWEKKLCVGCRKYPFMGPVKITEENKCNSNFSDDDRIAPDFFEYFTATYSILHTDPTVWCVSALNENGRSDLISDNPCKYPSTQTQVYWPQCPQQENSPDHANWDRTQYPCY